jgi:hypothetical protein
MNDKINHRFQTNNKSTYMKNCFKICSLALLTIAGVADVNAAETNLVQSLNFKLTAWSQGLTATNGHIVSVSASKQAIVTKDVIGWLGTATTNNFVNGQLLVINQLGAPISNNRIVVRTMTPATNDVDVSGFFFTFVTTATVNNYSYNNTNNSVNPGTYYGYWGFYLLSDPNYPLLPATFQTTGLGVDAVNNLVGKKKNVLGLYDQFSITNAAGIGQLNGKPFIIFGSITITGKTLEVHP